MELMLFSDKLEMELRYSIEVFGSLIYRKGKRIAANDK